MYLPPIVGLAPNSQGFDSTNPPGTWVSSMRPRSGIVEGAEKSPPVALQSINHRFARPTPQLTAALNTTNARAVAGIRNRPLTNSLSRRSQWCYPLPRRKGDPTKHLPRSCSNGRTIRIGFFPLDLYCHLTYNPPIGGRTPSASISSGYPTGRFSNYSGSPVIGS